MSSLSLEQWLQRLETLHPRDVDLGLERVSAVAHTLDLLPLKQPVITVGGTNGKGSTVAVLEALLHETGHSTGAFTSPHILRFNERIRIAGVEVSDADITAAFGAIDDARGKISLTYFEFAALAALLVFKAREPDIVILEVGLGGRLDAVNIVDPDVAVITSIDLDHQGWLGHTRGAIALEKSGIFRASKAAVIADPEPPAELLQRAEVVGASPVLYLGREFCVTEAGECYEMKLRGADGEMRRLGSYPRGAILPENISAALQAALLLGIEFSDESVCQALEQVTPVGRRQLRRVAGRDYVLDVAHNPAAVDKLLELLEVTNCKGKTMCLFSAMSDKDIKGMVEAAVGHFDAWFLADQPDNERAVKAADVALLLEAAGESMISISKNLKQAFRRVQSIAAKDDRLVVFGSFYTVAAILPLLDKEQNKYERH